MEDNIYKKDWESSQKGPFSPLQLCLEKKKVEIKEGARFWVV